MCTKLKGKEALHFNFFCRKYRFLYLTPRFWEWCCGHPPSSFVRLPLLISCLPPGTQHQPAVWSGPSWLFRCARLWPHPQPIQHILGWDLQQAHQPDRRPSPSQDSSYVGVSSSALGEHVHGRHGWGHLQLPTDQLVHADFRDVSLAPIHHAFTPSNAFAANQTHQGSYNTFRLHSPCALYGYNFSTSPKLAASPEKIVSFPRKFLGVLTEWNHDGSADVAPRGRRHCLQWGSAELLWL